MRRPTVVVALRKGIAIFSPGKKEEREGKARRNSTALPGALSVIFSLDL
jgi:hypothetical protein